MEIPNKLEVYEYEADKLSLDELKEKIRTIYNRFSPDELTDDFLNNLENLLFLLCDSGLWRSYTDFMIVAKFHEYVKEYIIRHLREDSCQRGKKESKWRLPTVNELLQVIQEGTVKTYNFKPDYYWTSEVVPDGRYAEIVSLVNMENSNIKSIYGDVSFYHGMFCKDTPTGLQWFASAGLQTSKMYSDVVKILATINCDKV